MRCTARSRWLLASLLICTGKVPGQAVISAHSGVLNYSEGSLLVDDHPLDQKFGTFPQIAEGSVVRTQTGRAEILLTPGAFLRLDENSSVRMLSESLSKTRVEFLSGAIILDTNNAPANSPIVVTHGNFEIRFPKAGVFRLDSDPGVFETYTGEAEIRAAGQAPKVIDESHQFFFGIATTTEKYGDGAIDNFSEWCRNRAETLAADQRAADQSTADPSATNPPDPGGLSPFSVPLPPSSNVPSYGFPGVGGGGLGGLSAGIYADNGFYGPYPMYNQPFYTNPLVIFWLYPRARTIPPRYGAPLRTGYPVLASPVTRGWPPTWHPTSTTYTHPPARSYVSPVRSASPAYSHPMPSAVGIGVHHR